MDKQNSLLGLLFGGMIILMIIAFLIEESHDHKTYEYPFANGVKSTTFIICGDSSLVTMDNGTHLKFIPEHLEEYINEDNRIK